MILTPCTAFVTINSSPCCFDLKKLFPFDLVSRWFRFRHNPSSSQPTLIVNCIVPILNSLFVCQEVIVIGLLAHPDLIRILLHVHKSLVIPSPLARSDLIRILFHVQQVIVTSPLHVQS